MPAKSRPLLHSILPLFATALCASSVPLSAEENLNRMLGRQAHNSGIPVVPAAKPVTIDGDLSEWNLKGKIWSFADVDVRDEYSVETAAMWDKDALYITAIWRDPTPMINQIDPNIDPTKGWVSDALQIRLSSDKTQWLTFWHYTPSQESILHIEEWPEKEKSSRDNTQRVLRGKSGEEMGEGVRIAYKKTEDGKGFIQEIRLPWTLLFKEVPKIEPGLSVNLGLEFIWGDQNGRRPFHRYADNLQPGVTSREFFWTAFRAWGPAQLLENGEVKPRTYIPEDWKLEGVANFEFELPAQARRFTVVIADKDGKHVRSLGGDLSPSDYQTKEADGKVTVSVPWDLRDNLNQLVPSGTYTATGLYHEGLQAAFDTYYYMPGSPPWQTEDRSSAWLSDHNTPLITTTIGKRTVVAAIGAEGGSGLIVLDENGKKLWGEHRGARALAADDRYIYALAYTEKATGTLWRYDQNGEYQPYTLNGEVASFDLTLDNHLDPESSVTALTVVGDQLLFALRHRENNTNQIVALHKETLKPGLKADAPGEITHLQTTPDGTVYGLIEGTLHQIDTKKGQIQKVALPGVEHASALAIDQKGRILVFDKGPDQQIKRFTPQGKAEGTIGKKGASPRNGRFDENGVRDVSSLSVGENGTIWAISSSMNPRRVSAWDESGKLVHSFLGNTQYSGTGTYLDPKNPDKAYIGALEFDLDRATGNHTLNRVLWNPDPEKNQAFELWSYPHWFANPTFLEREINGKTYKYLYHIGAIQGPRFSAVYLPKGDHYQPVSAVFPGSYAKRQLRKLEWPDHKQMTIFWNDTNRDGSVSLDECEIIPEELQVGGYWGSIPGKEMEIYAPSRGGVMIYRPEFDADGATRYSYKGIETAAARVGGDYYPIPEENQVLIIGQVEKHGKGIYGISPDAKEIKWHWPSPYNGVHGSHRAPMSRPGLIIGALKFMGIAHVNDEIGRVTAMRGNLGQDYYFTSDGLLIGALFRDTRLPRQELPGTVEEIKSMPLQTLTMGGEPFSGWLGKMSDGRILNTTSLIRNGASIVEIQGLDKVKRFKVGQPIQVTEALRVKADEMPPRLDPSEQKAVSYAIARIKEPLTLDPKTARQTWGTLKRGHIAVPTSTFTGVFAMGYDDKNLYVELEAKDPSPWKNTGRNFANLFKTGDAFDLQIGPADHGKRRNPGANDQRVLIANFGEKPTAVLMRPIDKEAPASAKHTYRSPVMDKVFDRVQIEERIQTSITPSGDKWVVRAIIPFEVLGLSPKAGDKLGADIGFISSDEAGTINTTRTYWSNRHTGLVNDEPSEAWFAPERWGTLEFLAAPQE